MSYGQVFGFRGILLPSIRIYGREVDAVIQLDQQEIERRAHARMQIITDRDLMEALALLPYRIQVPWASIDPVVQALIDQAPEAALRKDATYVERLYRPPLSIVGIVKRSRAWMRGLEAISLFAPHGPRGLVLLGKGSEHEALSRAGQLGIGIARKLPGAALTLLLRPSTRHIRSGPAQWLFSESVYGEWLDRYRDSAQAFS